jgi:hypothetical protein
VANADIVMTIDLDGHITEVAVQMDDDRVARLQRARQ